jgi:hypothetical protein
VRALDALVRLLRLLLPTGRPPGEPYPALRVVLLWAVTRAIGIVILVLAPAVSADVNYYLLALNGGNDQLPGGLREYPLPAVWLVSLPNLLARDDAALYPWLFLGLMLAVDAAFTWFLQRGATSDAVLVWLAAGPLVGPLLWTRFDIVTGAAVAAALILLLRRPVVSGLLVGAAALLKLWPVLLLPALGAPRSSRRPLLLAAVLLGAGVSLLVLVLEGPDRLLSPLRYQSARGVQIESLWALPLMAAWAVSEQPWQIFFSDYLALEIGGPGDGLVRALSAAATAVVVGLVAWTAVRLWRRPAGASATDVAWAVLSASALLVVANKVFSPQYLIWLVPVAAALIALDRSAAALRCAAALLVAGVLGQLIYPVLYVWIWTPGDYNLLGTALLALRLVPVIWVAWTATREIWLRSAPVRV